MYVFLPSFLSLFMFLDCFVEPPKKGRGKKGEKMGGMLICGGGFFMEIYSLSMPFSRASSAVWGNSS